VVGTGAWAGAKSTKNTTEQGVRITTWNINWVRLLIGRVKQLSETLAADIVDTWEKGY